jgi:hypothetical protein
MLWVAYRAAELLETVRFYRLMKSGDSTTLALSIRLSAGLMSEMGTLRHPSVDTTHIESLCMATGSHQYTSK